MEQVQLVSSLGELVKRAAISYDPTARKIPAFLGEYPIYGIAYFADSLKTSLRLNRSAMVDFQPYLPHFLQLYASALRVAQLLFAMVARYFTQTKKAQTQTVQIVAPRGFNVNGWAPPDQVPNSGLIGNSNVVTIPRIYRLIEMIPKDKFKVHLDVLAPTEEIPKLDQVNGCIAAASAQISHSMEDVEELKFVGHSAYLMAIIPFSTLKFDALCPNLTKAVIDGLVTTGAFRTVVAALQNLEDLNIGLVVGDDDDLGTAPQAALSHNHLKHLTLRSNVGVATVLKDLEFSRLEQFNLWLMLRARSECRAHNFAKILREGAPPCKLVLPFTPDDEDFTQVMKTYGITAQVPSTGS